MPDDSIKNNLATETARAKSSENTLATNLSAEVTNRINSDDSIKNNLAKETSRATTAETTIANNLLTETANRAIAEATISTNVSSIGTSVFLLSGSLAAETTNRTAADATITTNLNAETARAIAAEATKENIANKSTATALGTSDVLFPTQNAVKTYVDAASAGNSTALASEITNHINADDSH